MQAGAGWMRAAPSTAAALVGPLGLHGPAGAARAVDGPSVWFGENGSWDGDPWAGTGAAFTGLTGPLYIIGGRSSAAGGDRGSTFEVLGSYAFSTPAGALAGW